MNSFNKFSLSSPTRKALYSRKQFDDAIRSFLEEGGTIQRIEPEDPHPEFKSFLACRTQAPPHQFNLHLLGMN